MRLFTGIAVAALGLSLGMNLDPELLEAPKEEPKALTE